MPHRIRLETAVSTAPSDRPPTSGRRGCSTRSDFPQPATTIKITERSKKRALIMNLLGSYERLQNPCRYFTLGVPGSQLVSNNSQAQNRPTHQPPLGAIKINPHPLPLASTTTALPLNNQARNGTGCFPHAMATRKDFNISYMSPHFSLKRLGDQGRRYFSTT